MIEKRYSKSNDIELIRTDGTLPVLNYNVTLMAYVILLQFLKKK